MNQSKTGVSCSCPSLAARVSRSASGRVVPLGVGVEPLRLDPALSQLEAVCPTDLAGVLVVAVGLAAEEEVRLVQGGFLGRLRVQGELVAGDAVVRGPVRVGAKHCLAHVLQRRDDVRLAGGVGAEDTEDGVDREVPAVGERDVVGGGEVSVDVLPRDERQLLFVAQGADVRHPGSQQHPVCFMADRLVTPSGGRPRSSRRSAAVFTAVR